MFRPRKLSIAFRSTTSSFFIPNSRKALGDCFNIRASLGKSLSYAFLTTMAFVNEYLTIFSLTLPIIFSSDPHLISSLSHSHFCCLSKVFVGIHKACSSRGDPGFASSKHSDESARPHEQQKCTQKHVIKHGNKRLEEQKKSVRWKNKQMRWGWPTLIIMVCSQTGAFEAANPTTGRYRIQVAPTSAKKIKKRRIARFDWMSERWFENENNGKWSCDSKPTSFQYVRPKLPRK